VVWLPWVSKHEVDLSSRPECSCTIIYYAIAFLLTLIIEMIINVPLLRRGYAIRKIVEATIIANILSYLAGSVILYSVTFSKHW
jgi:hypothetical protein